MIPYVFTSLPGRCFRMIYSEQIQATHCDEPVVWKGPWRDRKGKQHVVEACERHGPKVRPDPGPA